MAGDVTSVQGFSDGPALRTVLPRDGELFSCSNALYGGRLSLLLALLLLLPHPSPALPFLPSRTHPSSPPPPVRATRLRRLDIFAPFSSSANLRGGGEFCKSIYPLHSGISTLFFLFFELVERAGDLHSDVTHFAFIGIISRRPWTRGGGGEGKPWGQGAEFAALATAQRIRGSGRAPRNRTLPLRGYRWRAE